MRGKTGLFRLPSMMAPSTSSLSPCPSSILWICRAPFTSLLVKFRVRAPTNEDNLFERASAIGFLGYQGGLDYHTRAGSSVDAGNTDRAVEIIEEGYAKIRSGELKKVKTSGYLEGADTTTWEQYREYAENGHEIGSHTITHPRLAILDETNMLYELQKSREEILDKLGRSYIFTVECPYGTENERVMEYAYKEYAALRNRMPEPFLHELNRWDTLTPGATNNKYVQWQRGPLSKTPMDLMKSWVDTVANHDNAWLVLVFHGVDGVGWEARTRQDLKEYYEYIAAKRDQLWVAPFRNVTQYMRERMDAKVQSKIEDDAIVVDLTHSLDTAWYNHPLTLKTLVPEEWSVIEIRQGDRELTPTIVEEAGERFVMYQAKPNAGEIRVTGKG